MGGVWPSFLSLSVRLRLARSSSVPLNFGNREERRGGMYLGGLTAPSAPPSPPLTAGPSPRSEPGSKSAKDVSEIAKDVSESAKDVSEIAIPGVTDVTNMRLKT